MTKSIHFAQAHPDSSVASSTTAAMLQNNSLVPQSILFAERHNELQKMIFGMGSPEVFSAMQLLSQAHALNSDFRAALTVQKKVYQGALALYGPDNEKCLQLGETLSLLTQQAVIEV